jgi:hypothetical protein
MMTHSPGSSPISGGSPDFEIGRSPTLIAATLGAYLLIGAAGWLLMEPLAATAWALLAAALAAGPLRRQLAPIVLRPGRDGRWRLFDTSGEHDLRFAVVRVHRYCIVLTASGGLLNRSIVIPADACPRGQHRRLRRALLWRSR